MANFKKMLGGRGGSSCNPPPFRQRHRSRSQDFLLVPKAGKSSPPFPPALHPFPALCVQQHLPSWLTQGQGEIWSHSCPLHLSRGQQRVAAMVRLLPAWSLVLPASSGAGQGGRPGCRCPWPSPAPYVVRWRGAGTVAAGWCPALRGVSRETSEGEGVLTCFGDFKKAPSSCSCSMGCSHRCSTGHGSQTPLCNLLDLPLLGGDIAFFFFLPRAKVLD